VKTIKNILRNKWFKRFAYFASACFLFIIFSNIWVNSFTGSYLYDDSTKIPKKNVAMVLGTSRELKDGRKNLFFEYRIQATVKLYKANKINLIVVSGDNSTKHYDEPAMMKEELVKRGIPACKISCDFAGFRTFDSVIRMWKVFGQRSFTIISQKFHNQRAVFIGRKYGLDVIGYNAKDVEGSNGLKTHIREYFARAKAVIDLYIWPAKAKFLGDKVKLSECD
jgi:SanA protein